MKSDRSRLLFVLDNDFGELLIVMYFLHRQALASRSTLLLPPRLYEPNADTLGVRTIPYRSYDDLTGALDAERAGVVLLFSGYLLRLHGLIPAGSLGDLVGRARSAGARVVTYDPFWGMMVGPHELFGAHYMEVAPFRALGLLYYTLARRTRALRCLTEAAGVLRSIPHLNPAPLVTSRVEAISFFNPGILASGEGGAAAAGPGTAGGSRPSWLFILGGEDHLRQEALHGRRQFAERLAATLQQACSNGRQPVLLAPKACLAAMRARPGVAGSASLLAFCSYPRFVSLLMRAEYVFYWNTISSSSLLRLVNHRPVFYFDRGHIGGGLGPVYRETVRWLYQGWQPPCLDQREPLDAGALARASMEARGAIETMCAHLRTAPTPEQVIERLLADVSPPSRVLDVHS